MSQPINHPLQRRNAFRRVPEIPRKHLSSGFAYLPESLQVNRLNHPVPQGTTTSTTPSNISTPSQAQVESSGPSVPSIPSDPSSSFTWVHVSSDASDSNDSHHVATTPTRDSWVIDDYVSDLDSDEEEDDPIMAPRRSVSPHVSPSDSDMDQNLNVPHESISEDTTCDMDYYSPCWHCSDSHYGKCDAQKAYEELARRYWQGIDNDEQLRQTDTRDFAAETNANGRAGRDAAALRAEARISRFKAGEGRVVGPAKPLESWKMWRRKKKTREWKGKEKVEGTGRDFLEGRINMNGELVGNARGSGIGDRKPKTKNKKGTRRFVKGFFQELALIAASCGCCCIGGY